MGQRVDLLLHHLLIGQELGIVRLELDVFLKCLGVLLGQQVNGLLQLCKEIIVTLSA